MSSTDRVFSATELADAGRLTVDLIGERLRDSDPVAAQALVERFRSELMTMFFSYTGWENSILDCIEQLDGQARRNAALASIENWEVAPERQVLVAGVAKRWNAELDSIKQLIDGQLPADAAARAACLRLEALALHDGIMSRVVALLSIVYDDHGEPQLHWVLGEVMRPEAMDPDGKIPFREKVEHYDVYPQPPVAVHCHRGR